MTDTPESDPKVLSLEEVNAVLPQVVQVLERLQQLQHAIVDSKEQREELRNELTGGNGHSRIALQDQLVAEAETTFNQLSAFGAILKDLDSGLVDFYGQRAGELIFLCWRLGEEVRIQFWHTLEGGVAGRQPVDDLIR